MKENIKDYINTQGMKKITVNKDESSKEKKKLKIDSGSFYPKSKRPIVSENPPVDMPGKENLPIGAPQFFPMYYGNIFPRQPTPIMPYVHYNVNSNSLKYSEEKISYKVPITKIKTDASPFVPKNIVKDEIKMKDEIEIKEIEKIDIKKFEEKVEYDLKKDSMIIKTINEKSESIKTDECIKDFIRYNNKKQFKNRYDIDYLLSFKKWKICNEKNLINP